MNKKLILFVLVAVSLTSCGLSEEARQLEETNLELSNRLRRAESVVIPAMKGHIDNLEDVVNANQEVQNDIEAARSEVERASQDLGTIVASIPESVLEDVEVVMPEEIPHPKDDSGDKTAIASLLASQREDIERTHQHNADAGTMRDILRKLDEIGQSLGDTEVTLEGASEGNRVVTTDISDEVTAIADTTEVIATEISDASALADDAAERARSIRDKADVANIIGGAISNALGSLPIPGASFAVNNLPKPDAVVPRSTYDAATSAASSDSEDGFPYWIIPILLGGGGASLISKKVRGGVGKVFGKKSTTQDQTYQRPSGPGQSSDARFLGEALMRLENQERAEAGSDVEDRLAQILLDRRRRRTVDDGRVQSIDRTRVVSAPANIPGQSGVFSMPSERVG